jgi:hypothetical protein
MVRIRRGEAGVIPVWFVWAVAALGGIVVGSVVVWEVIDPGPDKPPIDLFVGPAPETLGPCEISAAAAQGLRWNGEEDGWRADNFPEPVLTDDYDVDRLAVAAWKSQMEVLVDAAFVAIDACPDAEASPSPSSSLEPTPSPSASGLPSDASVAGIYATTEDESRRSTGTGDALDPLGCAGRRVPPDITVLQTGTTLQFTFVDTPGQPTFTANGTYDPATGAFLIPYPDGAKAMEGLFVTFSGKPEMRDAKLYSGDCTFFFGAIKR